MRGSCAVGDERVTRSEARAHDAELAVALLLRANRGSCECRSRPGAPRRACGRCWRRRRSRRGWSRRACECRDTAWSDAAPQCPACSALGKGCCRRSRRHSSAAAARRRGVRCAGNQRAFTRLFSGYGVFTGRSEAQKLAERALRPWLRAWDRALRAWRRPAPRESRGGNPSGAV